MAVELEQIMLQDCQSKKMKACGLPEPADNDSKDAVKKQSREHFKKYLEKK